MKILFFGSLAEKAGVSELDISAVSTLAALKELISKRYPGLVNRVYAIAVNETIVNGDAALKETDEVAFMPPFSGG